MGWASCLLQIGIAITIGTDSGPPNVGNSVCSLGDSSVGTKVTHLGGSLVFRWEGNLEPPRVGHLEWVTCGSLSGLMRWVTCWPGRG